MTFPISYGNPFKPFQTLSTILIVIEMLRVIINMIIILMIIKKKIMTNLATFKHALKTNIIGYIFKSLLG